MATGILLPQNQFQSRSSPSSIHPHPSTSSLTPSSHSRRIRFAPLPDPHRAVLITDDGAELPIPLPDHSDLNHIPTSLLISSPPASPRNPLNPLNDIRPDTSDERENSSGSSYLSSSSSTSASSTSTPRTTTPSDVSPISSLTSSPVAVNSALPATKCTPPLLASQSSPPSAWPKPRYISNLLPFKRASTSSSSSSSHSLTPTPSIEAQGQGHAQTARKAVAPGLSLFRTSSRDSTDSASTATTTGWGLGLSRWTSANANERPSQPVLNGSSPLARTQSAQSYKSKSKMSLFASPSPSSASTEVQKSQSAGPKLPGQNRHKGARMLNGRVYGSKRPANANPFANARDDDVEFVEWGYGGMGSVKGAKSAGMAAGSKVNWERLHGADSTKQGVGGAFGVTDDDGDDGSGMGWVKKRREERERKKREAEELAAKEAEAQQLQADQDVTDSSKSTPTPTRTSTMDGLGSKEEESEDGPTSAATVVPSTYTPSAKGEVQEIENTEADKGKGELKEGFVFGGTTVDEPVELEKEREHMPVAVVVPVRPRHHHHHHHSHSHSHRHARSLSKDALLDDSVCNNEHDESLVTVTPIEQQPNGEREKRNSISSQSTSESESETDDEDEEAEDEREDDEEEEEEEEEEDESKVNPGRRPRKTALGAGVEKISRHKEKE